MFYKLNKDFVGEHRSQLLLVFCDAVLVGASMVGALWMRFDFHFGDIDAGFLDTIYHYLPINLACTLLLFRRFRLYSYLWQYAGAREMCSIIGASCTSSAMQFAGMHLLGWAIPRSFVFLYGGNLMVLVAASRYLYRWCLIQRHVRQAEKPEDSGVRTMIIGAGEAGHLLVNEIKNSKHLGRKLCCILDDNPAKVGTFLRGVPVVGYTYELDKFIKLYQVDEIIIAIPSMKLVDKQTLMKRCSETSCKVMHLPGLYQLINGEVSVSMLRKVDINDLLGRPEVALDTAGLVGYIRGKTVLVTGAGGSIGSEICRQLLSYYPKRLILFDSYENSTYSIHNELLESNPDLELEVLIGSVCDEARVDWMFQTYHPDLVFHAAAHKHVPLMEDSPNEAIKNNVLGTWVVARAADQYHARKMVLISTDKAVRPTNIMGASKRICELVIQSVAQNSKTEFAAVRFGNVLGSNGSVVPLFRRQIAMGGPVTVTHPEVTRYFMTIPEAVSLVLQCGALAAGGEIFILDMGKPVKILDLAKDMIRLSGLEPEKDIPIRFVGLRPGEKLYEELLIDSDDLEKTINERIFVARQPQVNVEDVQRAVQQLINAAFAEVDDIRERVMAFLPEYTPQSNDLHPRTREVCPEIEEAI